MAYIVMACIARANIVRAYTVMAYIVMALYSHAIELAIKHWSLGNGLFLGSSVCALYRYCLYSYGLYSYGPIQLWTSVCEGDMRVDAPMWSWPYIGMAPYSHGPT